jgi:serine/threonine-protein kinase
MNKAIAIAFLTLIVLAVPLRASAQGENKAAAEALYQQGVRLFKGDKYAEAAEKFDASQKLDPAIGTLLYLGDCYEKLDKNASAWAAFKEAASLAQSRKDRRQKTAEVRAAALLPQVSHLVVRVADEVLALPGFTIRRNGVELPTASVGVPLPLDAGEVKLEATASGHEPWTKTVTIVDGGKEISVDVPMLASQTVEPSPSPSPDVPQPPPLPEPGPDTGDDSGVATVLLISGIAVGVLGLGGVAVGSAFGLMARDSRDESLARCRTETLCTPEGVSLREDAQSEATVSTITFVVGGVLVAGGVALVVLSTLQDDGADETGLRSLEVVPTGTGAMLRGAW